jgi:hypothetical protein
MKLKRNVAISENGFIFDSTNGNSFSINPIGIEIIDFIKQNFSFNEIVGQLSNKYETEVRSLEKDLIDFISQLKQYQIVED